MLTRARACTLVLLLPLAAAGGTAGAATDAGTARVLVHFPRGSVGTDCSRVAPRTRHVRRPAVLAGALRALLAGPTSAERRLGYGGWFSARTAGSLRSVRIARGIASVDLAPGLPRLIPNASSACGGALLLAQLDRTAVQFPTVRRAVYSLGGSRSAFYSWLQLSVPRG